MSNNHISFEKMSDLYDNEISTREEMESIFEHIENCEHCNEEYKRLKKTVNILSNMKNMKYDLGDLSEKTTAFIKWKRKKKTFRKVFYPVAASVLFLFGIGLFNNFVIDQPGPFTMGKGISGITNNNFSKISGTEKIVKILSNNNAKVIKVAEQFVEGEISYDKFRNLRRSLGFNGFQKIRYMILPESKIAVSNDNNNRYNKNIENVGAGNKLTFKKEQSNKKRYIRFKIFL